uniref:Uncharacterized protein n=1 Tax=Anopheles atroparvus TaxID=41427 RepID=A0A182IV46_ANOAO
MSVSTEKPTASREILPSGAFRSCLEEPTKRSGKYRLQVRNGTESFEGFCEQTLFGGGWLVIQNRFDGTVDFYRNWTEYRRGFGDIDREYWIGLERLHQLTSSRPHQLLIEVKTSAGEYGYAQYSAFEIGSEAEQYSLKQLGTYNGFGFELLMAKLDYLQNQLDGIGHNITLLQNVSASVHAKQFTCNTLEKMSVTTEKPTASLEILPSGAFRSCRQEPTKRSGKYRLQVRNGTESFEGTCEQTLFGGGWLVIQHRYDGTVEFYRNWTEYRRGFGDIDREFWIGLERLHQLTSSKPHQLLIELTDSTSVIRYAQYSAFEIGSEAEQYSLKQLGTYNGTVGDSLKYHTGKKFTTRDRDNDDYTKNCAVEYGGAWWYNACHYANLNGMYIRGKVAWMHFEQSAILTVHNHVITRNPRISVTHDKHDKHKTWFLHISNVQEEDKGRYMCQINTVTAKTQFGYLHVVVPPNIDDSLSSSDVIVREGSNVTLKCRATGSPTPTVKWKRDDNSKIAINRSLNVPEWEGNSIEITKISRLDMGAYLCIASNGVPPTVSKRIKVSVDCKYSHGRSVCTPSHTFALSGAPKWT